MTEVVRQMAATDLDQCAQIFVAAYDETYSEVWPVKQARARLDELYAGAPRYCFVAAVDAQVSGFLMGRPFAWNDGPRIWFEEVVVRKDRRRHGVASMLMRALFERCRVDGVSGLSLVSSRDSVAFRLYERWGFQASVWVHMEAALSDLSDPGGTTA
jgi:GNAT superfamily N-acetyltransferase